MRRQNSVRSAVHSSLPDASSPVSYTHLDVYKRQMAYRLVENKGDSVAVPQLVIAKLPELEDDWLRSFWQLTTMPVGIWMRRTALLDVYKRQLL